MVFASGEENVHAVSAVTSGARATLNLWLTFDEALSATRAGDEFEEHRGAIREPRKNARGEKKAFRFSVRVDSSMYGTQTTRPNGIVYETKQHV